MKLQSCVAFWYFVPIGLHPQKSIKGHFDLPHNCLNTDLCTVKCFDHCLRCYLKLKEVSSCKHGRSISKSPMWPCCGAGGWGKGNVWYLWIALFASRPCSHQKRDQRANTQYERLWQKQTFMEVCSYGFLLRLCALTPTLILILVSMLIPTSITCRCHSVPNPVSFDRKLRFREIK